MRCAFLVVLLAALGCGTAVFRHTVEVTAPHGAEGDDRGGGARPADGVVAPVSGERCGAAFAGSAEHVPAQGTGAIPVTVSAAAEGGSRAVRLVVDVREAKARFAATPAGGSA
jgi:hypothetical protein